MLRRICLSTSTALALTATCTFATAEPVVRTETDATMEAPATPVVGQGDSVYVEGNGLCTIAFNDPGQRASYTAGHCGAEGDRAIVSGEGFRATGTFYPSAKLGQTGTANDWGMIRWADGVELGPNSRTGNAVVAPSTLRSGDPVCVYGAATKKTTCGSFAGRLGNNIYWDGPSGKPGDSGGPVWVEGKGFLSVYTGISLAVSEKGEQGRLNRSSVPDNGPEVAPEDELELIATAKSIKTPVVHETAVPGGESAPVEQGSSDRVGEIAAVIAIILAGVLLALPEIAKVLPEGTLPVLGR